MKNYVKSRGFTLIELLVVISIIGLMSSIVVASLTTARTRSADTAIKSSLDNVRKYAALFYDNSDPNSYGTPLAPTVNGTCSPASGLFADPNVQSVVSGALANAVSNPTGQNQRRCAIGTGGQSWALSVPLKTAGDSLCVDSSGDAPKNGYAAFVDCFCDGSQNVATQPVSCHPKGYKCGTTTC